METIATASAVKRPKAKSKKVTTVIRVDPELLEKIKYSAKKEHLSVNSFVERVMEIATKPNIPHLPKNFILDTLDLIPKVRLRKVTQEELDADPKLAYLWEKYHLDEVAYED